MDEGTLDDRDVFAVLSRPKKLVHLIFGGELNHIADRSKQSE